jgi:hypothetical protein
VALLVPSDDVLPRLWLQQRDAAAEDPQVIGEPAADAQRCMNSSISPGAG